jgi:hypothetical protein
VEGIKQAERKAAESNAVQTRLGYSWDELVTSVFECGFLNFIQRTLQYDQTDSVWYCGTSDTTGRNVADIAINHRRYVH